VSDGRVIILLINYKGRRRDQPCPVLRYWLGTLLEDVNSAGLRAEIRTRNLPSNHSTVTLGPAQQFAERKKKKTNYYSVSHSGVPNICRWVLLT
jgi:hypothetical protein